MRLVLLVLLLLVTVVAPARAAWTPPPASQVGMRDAFLPIERAAWTGSSCAGREVFVVDADASIAGFDSVDGFLSLGRAFPETCTVELRHIADPWVFCTAMVHEGGHLAGFSHSGEPGSQAPPGPLADVMSGARVEVFPACARRLEPAARDWRGWAVWKLWMRLPGGRGRWSISCGRGRCVVRDLARTFTSRIYLYSRAGNGVRVEGPRYFKRPPVR